MTLQTNLTMIKLILNDIRSGSKYNSNDTKSLRYLITNIHNYLFNSELGYPEKDIDYPDYAFMSEKFKEVWEAAGKPAGSSALKKHGICEHVTPFNVIISRMAKECLDEHSILDFVSKHHKLVYITKDEDNALNEAGYQRILPENGGNRYEIVGIKIHSKPVVYKNFGKYKNETI